MSKLGKSMIPLVCLIGVGIAINSARSSNVRAVRKVFREWSSGNGSLFDLMIEDALIIIPGTAPHCGTFSKDVFMKNIATPFMSRFSKPPTPRPLKIWSDGDDVAVLANAQGTTRDGKPYANNYVFVLKMRDNRIARATEFLDMAAFNDVRDGVEPGPVGAAGVS